MPVCLRSEEELQETGILGFEVSVTSVQVPAMGRDMTMPVLWPWNKFKLSDRCAMAALRAYAEAARQMGCTDEFVEDLECNVLPDFRDFQAQEPEKVKLPD